MQESRYYRVPMVSVQKALECVKWLRARGVAARPSHVDGRATQVAIPKTHPLAFQDWIDHWRETAKEASHE